MSDFGKQIAKYRRKRGMSAQDLSDVLGGTPSRSSIANWETGRRKDITVTELVSVAGALSVEPVMICPELDTGHESRVASARFIIDDAIERATRLLTGAATAQIGEQTHE
ncbi:helix-turn-helix domain-containing protein [Leucobacter sp. GX24907]